MNAMLQAPYREPEDTTTRWVLIFILLSLLAHAIIIIAILLLTLFAPVPKFTPEKPEDQKMTLSLVAPPPAPPKKPIFMPTHPQQNVTPKQQPIESANDVMLQSRSTSARLPDSLLPDVTGKEHAQDMNNSPQVKAQPTPQVASTPPVPKTAQPQKPAPPTPQPQTSPRPMPPQLKQTPPKTTPPPPKAQPTVDPDTGLPVLPPIMAQTMATPEQAKPLAPSSSDQQVAGSIHGSLGRSGDNSPAAMATELGKYKQYVYSVVGSYWYPDIDKHFGLIPVGVVHIQFTIHSDGTISDVTILEGDNLEQLRSISKNALVAPAPFKAFPPGLIKDVGDSYTDDFSFSVY